MDRYTKFRDDLPIRSRVIVGKTEGGCINPPVPARVHNWNINVKFRIFLPFKTTINVNTFFVAISQPGIY